MSLDRQAIEKRDFPISRRGYETLAVDAHLAQLAREVEALQAERLTADPVPTAATPSLASSASEQVRSIVQAAERSAAEIEQQASDDAARQRSDAATAADATRAAAEADAQAHVSAVQGEVGAMLEKIQSVESLLEQLRSTAQEIQGGLDALHAQVGTLGGPAAVRDALTPAGGGSGAGDTDARAVPPTPAAPYVPPALEAPVSPVVPAVLEAPVSPVVPPAPEASASAVTAPVVPETPATVAPVAALSDDEAGARMVALSLVLDGIPREQVARHLDDHYALDDRDALLDDLYARQPSP